MNEMNDKVGFWCENCKEDQELAAVVSQSFGVRWFAARCPQCRAKLIRYIDNKTKDPYYWKSKKLNFERKTYQNDLIQPGQPGFNTVFDKAHKEIEEAAAKYEKRKQTDEEEKELLYQKYKHDINSRQLLEKTFKAEDKYLNG